MVKRYGNLWPKVITKENIRLSYEQAKLGKGKKRNVRLFNRDLENNLEKVRQSLVNKTFTTAHYSTKTVFEPKRRTIYILPFNPDRIVQHAVMNVLIPIWDNLFIAESYACRDNKGMHKGSLKTMEYIRGNRYCLKCDISKFYPSINHDVLKSIVRRKIKDKDVLWLIDDIIDSYPGETNTPIGNFTSQWFGNLYLNELDQFVRHQLKIKCYLRYCDDFCLFHNDKKVLNDAAAKIRQFLTDRLRLRMSKCDLFPVSRGVDFLGYRHFPEYILLRKSTAKRARKRIKKAVYNLHRHKITAEQFRSVIASYDGWMKWAKTYNLRIKLDLDRLREASKNARTANDILARL